MNKILLLISVVCGLLFSANAQNGAADIKFAASSHDFGNINQGDVVNFTFKFTNTGNAPLVIHNVLTTCGCTAPSWPKQAIPPGATGEIPVTFNSSGKMGVQNKIITVMSNAKEPEAKVKIMSNVMPKPAEK